MNSSDKEYLKMLDKIIQNTDEAEETKTNLMVEKALQKYIKEAKKKKYILYVKQ